MEEECSETNVSCAVSCAKSSEICKRQQIFWKTDSVITTRSMEKNIEHNSFIDELDKGSKQLFASYLLPYCYPIQIFLALSKHADSACAALQLGSFSVFPVPLFPFHCCCVFFSVDTSVVDNSFFSSSPEAGFSCDGVP